VTAPPSNACGVTPQCGCAANQTCDVTNLTTGAVGCVLAGGGPVGSYCTATTQCAQGLTCQNNACRPYCNNPGSACATAGGGVCYSPQDASGNTTPNLSVCAVKCDVRSPATACGSNNCLWFAADKESDCRPAGTAALYDPCASAVDCQSGLACVNHPLFGYECEKWCRIGGSDCGLLETCTDVYGANAPTSGGVKLGHCQ